MRPTEPVRRPEVDRRERRLRDQLQRHDWQIRRLRRQDEDAAAALRRRDQAERGRHPSEIDDLLLVWAVPVAAVLALPLLVGHLSALLVHGGVPSYRLREAPGIIGRLVTDPGDPGSAWEAVNTGTAVPGPVAWWGTFGLVAVIGALVLLLAWAAMQPAGRRRREGWATWPDLRHLWVRRRADDDRLVVGANGGRLLGLHGRHSLLVVGPAHSGKTSGVTVPAILEWSGPVVVATSKGHPIDETIGWRSRHGDVHVFDPAAVTRYHRSGWSLLAGCGTWQGAMRTASDLTRAARAATAAGGGDPVFAGRSDLWQSSMAVSLAPYLFAAVASGRSIRAAIEWIEREDRDQVLDILDGADRTAARTHRTTFSRPDPDRGAFLHGIHQILSVYQDPVVSPSMDRHEVMPDELLDGGPHTLYLTAPEYDQARFRPLCAMVLRQVLAAAYARSSGHGRPLDEPLLVVLDDAVGVAPVVDLAALASTAAARGVQLVSVFQDLAQVTGHYGDDAPLVVGNHAAKLVLPSRTHVASAGGSDALLRPELADELGQFEAALLYDTSLPARVRLRPWFRDKELTRRVETPQDAVEPAADAPVFDRPDPAEQTALWLRRGRGARPTRDEDPTIPLDIDDPDYVAVFGRIDDEDSPPSNVTPLSDRWFRG